MRFNLFTLSIFSAFFFWFVESGIHYLIFGDAHFEFIPHDANEFWMRSLVCLLMVMVGFLAERHVRDKEDIHAEKLRTLKATVNTVQDLVGNSLNSLQLICIELEAGKIPDQKSLNQIQKMVTESSGKLKKLAEITEVIEVEKASGILTLYTSKFK